MSWAVFLDGRMGLSSLLDALLESLDPMESPFLDPLLESSSLSQYDSESLLTEVSPII
jgi:hypothetical protein